MSIAWTRSRSDGSPSGACGDLAKGFVARTCALEEGRMLAPEDAEGIGGIAGGRVKGWEQEQS